jgi:thioredoxin reductase
MDKFREQSVRFGTTIITETVSKIDLSSRPFRYWREMQENQEPETADTIIIATGASAKRLGLKGEQTYWQSGISACAVCDGAVPIFRYVSHKMCTFGNLSVQFTGTSPWLSLVEVTPRRKKRHVYFFSPYTFFFCS